MESEWFQSALTATNSTTNVRRYEKEKGIRQLKTAPSRDFHLYGAESDKFDYCKGIYAITMRKMVGS
jgi:hypothetical protein